MKRPLFFIFIFLIFGIISYLHINNIYFLLSIFIFVLFLSFYFANIYKTKYCRLFFLIYILGYFLMFFNNKIGNLENTILNSENITAYGVIKDFKKTKNGDFNLEIKINELEINNRKIKKNFYVVSYLEGDNKIEKGYGIKFSGKFQLGKLPSNPNGFNEYINLKANNIDFKVYIKDYKILGINEPLLYYLGQLNKKIGEIYDNILPKEESGILKSIILGDKNYLEESTKNIYRNAGIYHILAISGLHIGILALFLSKIFNKISKRYGNIFVILILIAYCIFTGGNLSTIRATFMASIMLLAKIIYRDYDMISAISLSGIILIFINPFNLYNIGFLYSYISVFSIAFLGLGFINLYELKGLKSAFVVSFFVSLAIKPISAYYFYNVNTIDFLFNLLIIPFTSVIVCLGFLISILGIFSLSLAKFLAGTIYYIFRFFTFMCKTIDKISFANISIERPSIFLIISFYIMLILIGYSIYEKRLFYKRQKYINLGLFIFLICITIEIFKPTQFKLTMLDVGQGECIVGEKGKDTFLIDSGSTLKKNVGENVLLPYLKSKGINDIDFLFISHMDSDHINGIFEIIGNIDIENIFIPNVEYENKNYEKLIRLANENNINIYKLKNGDKLTLGKDINFYILSPYKNFNNKKENNNSLVIKMEYKNTKTLFTGDIEKETENIILNELEDIDILKVAHHGSKTSTNIDFFEKIKPEVSLISCGKNNIYKHPSKETLETLKKTQVFRTDENGAIIIKFLEDKYKIKTILK